MTYMNTNEIIIVDDNGEKKRSVRLRLPYALDFALLFAISVICITIVSKCSPLYAFHDGSDLNWFLTMGRGMANGMVPYKDLFEQKGVYLYMLFALNYLICGNSLYVIYVIEIICFTAFLWLAYKICTLFAGRGLSLLCAAGTAVVVCCCYAFFSGGGETEEYCLPMLAFGAYVLLRYFKRGDVPLWLVAVCGLFSGIIFWIKYTVLIFFAAMAVCLFVDRCIKRDVKGGFIYAAVFVAAFAVISVPALVYLGVNGAIGDMWRVYIVDNIFAYSSGRSFAQSLATMWGAVSNVLKSFLLYLFVIFGVVWLWRGGALHEKRFKVYYTCIFAATFVVHCLIFGGIAYYHLVIGAFVPVGFLGAKFCICGIYSAVISLFKGRGQPYRQRFASNYAAAEEGSGAFFARAGAKLRVGVNVHTCALAAAIVAVICLLCGNCTLELFYKLDYYPQFKAAEAMEEEGGGSLLSYKIYDRGFYAAYDETPEFYYFAQNNFDREDYPELFEEQESYVENGLADFVVTELSVWEEEQDTLLKKYEYMLDLSYTHIEFNTKRDNAKLVLLKLF